MLTQKLRPKTFSEVVGQSLNVEILKSVTAHPEDAPRVYILQGSWGTGKTTLARVFSRILNCEKGKKEACLTCSNCRENPSFSPFYQEYDATEVGNVSTIRAMKDDLMSSASRVKWRVVVFDEAHKMSTAAMEALLKILEELSQNVFVLFCTTEVDKLPDTIRSRAIELVFSPIPIKDIYLYLQDTCAKQRIDIDSEVLGKIAYYSRGHMRDAIMRLNMYQIIDDKKIFVESITSGYLDLLAYFKAVRTGDKEGVQMCVDRLISHTLGSLKTDYFELLKESVKLYVSGSGTAALQETVNLYQTSLFDLLRVSTSAWASTVFESDLTLQAFLWYIYYNFKPAESVMTSMDSIERSRKK